MSEEQSELRKKEIEELVAEDERMVQEMDKDTCPYCSRLTKTFEYIAFFPQFGWLECTGCGVVFCPPSLRRRKLENMQKARPSIVVPS